MIWSCCVKPLGLMSRCVRVKLAQLIGVTPLRLINDIAAEVEAEEAAELERT
jgi:hypothetical protein